MCHPEKPEAKDGFTPKAKPISGGQAQKTRGQTTGRGRQSPQRIALQIIIKVIVAITAPKYTWETFTLTESV